MSLFIRVKEQALSSYIINFKNMSGKQVVNQRDSNDQIGYLSWDWALDRHFSFIGLRSTCRDSTYVLIIYDI